MNTATASYVPGPSAREGEGCGRIFVVGHRKSGSTWLLQLLCLHPDIRGVDETHAVHLASGAHAPEERARRLLEQTPFGNDGRVLRKRIEEAILRWKSGSRLAPHERPVRLHAMRGAARRRLRRRLRVPSDGEQFCRTLFDELERELKPRRYLLEKSPSHVEHLPLLRRWFPHAKLISISRDGRDVAVSERFFVRRYEPGRRSSIEESAREWRRRLEYEREFARHDSLFRCTYERLHADGKGLVAELLGFLGLDADPALIEHMLASASFEAQTGRRPGHESRRAFLRKGVPGDWRNHLGPADKEAFKRAAGDLLIQLGYERDDRW